MWSCLLGVLLLSYVATQCVPNSDSDCDLTSEECLPSVTTVSGTHASRTVCSGELIFADEFEEFDLEKWQHENTLSGSGVSRVIVNLLRL